MDYILPRASDLAQLTSATWLVMVGMPPPTRAMQELWLRARQHLIFKPVDDLLELVGFFFPDLAQVSSSSRRRRRAAAAER